MKRKNKLVLSCVAATLMTASALCVLPGCSWETKHPKVTITMEFEGKTYALNYTLYRNMYAQTVKHFIELADNGFYDNTLIHDYRTNNDFVGGLFNYDKDAYKSAYDSGAQSVRGYLDSQYKLDAYNALYTAGKMTQSVYMGLDENGKVDKSTATNTVMGEFSENQHKIKTGALKSSFGALKMVYYTSTSVKTQCYSVRWDKSVITDHYRYDSATSGFAMQIGSGSSFQTTSYAVFGKLSAKADEERLNALLDVIADMKVDESFDVKTIADGGYALSDVESVNSAISSFTATQKPLIVKSVKVKKY